MDRETRLFGLAMSVLVVAVVGAAVGEATLEESAKEASLAAVQETPMPDNFQNTICRQCHSSASSSTETGLCDACTEEQSRIRVRRLDLELAKETAIKTLGNINKELEELKRTCPHEWQGQRCTLCGKTRVVLWTRTHR